MAGVLQLIRNNGDLPGLTSANEISPRRRGVYKGIFFFLLAFLVVPILTMITVSLEAEPYAVVGAAVLFTVGGLLRIAYAMMFESSVPGSRTLESSVFETAAGLTGRAAEKGALPPQLSIPVDAYSPPAGGWKANTNDLSGTPGSVTDTTTKLLRKEEDQ